MRELFLGRGVTLRIRRHGALAPCLLLAAVGCEEVQPAAEEPAVKLWTVQSARGPVTLPYVEIDGWAVADDDILLGRVDGTRLRDFHTNLNRWPNGIIPYVWNVSDEPAPACGLDKTKFCADEVAFLTQSPGESGLSIWDEFRQNVVAETNLSLVDLTGCLADPGCASYYETGTYMVIQRPTPRTADDNEVQCDAINNTTLQKTSFTLEDAPGEIWDLTIGVSAWTIPGVGLGEADAQAIVDAVTADPDYDSLPVVVSRDGATVVVDAKLPEDIVVALSGDHYERTHTAACVGAKGCGNSDCPAGQTCVAVWPYSHDFAPSDEGYCQQGGGIAHLGYPGPGGDLPTLGLPTSWFHRHANGSMAHELMHVAGFIHEHQRPDAFGTLLTVADTECALIPGTPDLEANNSYELMGWASPLDWASAMMYSSKNLCLPTPECENMCINAVSGACPGSICEPNDAYNAAKPDPNLPDLDIVKRSGWYEGLDRLGNKIDRGELGLSYKDQDALRMVGGDAFAQAFVEGQCPWYPDDGDHFIEFAYSGVETRDNFGSALAIGRFGDEDSGVLVGMPGEEEDYLDIKTGAVTVWESNRYVLPLDGTAPAWEALNKHVPAIPILAPDQFMVPEDFGDQTVVEAGDSFGQVVAAVDFNGDGIDEIAVGAPKAGFNDSGLVYIYHTNDAKRKHAPWRILKPDTDLDAWEFGYALAAGNFAGTAIDDSCAGAERHELAVGAPRMVDGTGLRNGAVYVYRWDSVAKDFVRRDVAAPLSNNNQRFGHALAAADLDGDHRDGLVVGAPLYGTDDRGRVFFHESDAPADGCHMQLQYKGNRTGGFAGARLGSAIAAGDFLRGTGATDSPDDVAVGAPRPGNAGYVELFKGTGSPLAVGTIFTPHATLKQVANGFDADETGDEFGAALAVTEYTPVKAPWAARPATLFIGAPGETNNAAEPIGAVYSAVFTYDIASVGPSYKGDVRSTSPCDAGETFGCGLVIDPEPELADRFGAAIAASSRILVIGDPSFDMPDGGGSVLSDAGAARIYVRERDPKAQDGWHLMRWFTEVNQWPTVKNGEYVPAVP